MPKKSKTVYKPFLVALPKRVIQFVQDDSSAQGITPSEYVRRLIVNRIAHAANVCLCDLDKTGLE